MEKTTIEKNRELFAKKYKEAFGIDLDVEQLAKDYQDKIDKGDYITVFNYYGIKSPWM